eukprot:TRINITY_DN1099_c0_g1_i1.p2 TRINITY_DN1099_c0_g1~~TRINITY_DN1099_c0_g1_i1.p2  ORF type:complete len:168 (-),score=10.20 TRINITY_DN1099_c0_g1_i1:273-776(-)
MGDGGADKEPESDEKSKGRDRRSGGSIPPGRRNGHGETAISPSGGEGDIPYARASANTASPQGRTELRDRRLHNPKERADNNQLLGDFQRPLHLGRSLDLQTRKIFASKHGLQGPKLRADSVRRRTQNLCGNAISERGYPQLAGCAGPGIRLVDAEWDEPRRYRHER